ncbi:MAG: response regulator transcription factor [Burkholderiales bacterium]|nr:response regulator transcription factor [Burkholderiales bacterium]
MTAAARALIAEDEPLLAAALAHELRKAWPALQVAATVGDGLSAVRQALDLRPDVLFFDIRMPGLTGIDAAAELADAWPQDTPFPALVFVTAYDQYAVQAFEAQAVDYLLKPVQAARLARTVHKVQAQLAQRRAALPTPMPSAAALHTAMDQLRALLAMPGLGAEAAAPGASAAAPGAAPRLQVIQASSGTQIHMVPVADVVYFEAADKYVRVLTAEREYLIRTPLKELIVQLDAQEFWQIHRSTLVRATRIASVLRDESGKQHVLLTGRPERLPVSRLYAHLFKGM